MVNDTMPRTNGKQTGAGQSATIGDAPNRSLRCLIVHAPDPIYASTQNYGAMFMPVWAYTLAAHVPMDGRFELQLCDTRFDSLDKMEAVDVALFSGINQDHDSLLATHTALRRRFPNMISILGGPICWSFDQAGDLHKLADFDHIFIGDGEPAIASLLERIRTEQPLDAIIRNPKRFDMAQARACSRPPDPTSRTFIFSSFSCCQGRDDDVGWSCNTRCSHGE